MLGDNVLAGPTRHEVIDTVEIAGRRVGSDEPSFVVAEIGINHNGDIDLVRKLISAAVTAGCDAVKFQKRTVDVVYSREELERPRESPYGTTNGDLKRGLELDHDAFSAIDEYCGMLGIAWFSSCWDQASVDILEQFDPPCYKIASASLTDDGLLRHHRQYGRPIILSTGMSELAEIDHAVEVLGVDDLVLLHATSTYPSQPAELNL
ncbi:MAG: N-acetylneuraminate synthase family protein, partial [Gemmatimonadota bacterium]